MFMNLFFQRFGDQFHLKSSHGTDNISCKMTCLKIHRSLLRIPTSC
jgi:hypothetical protein